MKDRWYTDVLYCLLLFKALANLDEFRNLDRDIEGSAKRWKKFVESEAPEKEKFPQEWKNKSALQKLCIMRALRPDRMTYAIKYVMMIYAGTSERSEITAMGTFFCFEDSVPQIIYKSIRSPKVSNSCLK